jgi:hypothetical protein
MLTAALGYMSHFAPHGRVLRGVSSRIVFGAELGYAMHIRGLSLTEVARLSAVAVATASAAAAGRPVNVTTALRVARAVAARPVIPELLEWVERPLISELRSVDVHPADAPERRRRLNSGASATNHRGGSRRVPGLGDND